MAGIRTVDLASFKTIEVSSIGHRTMAYPVDSEGRKADIEFGKEATTLLIKGIRRRFHQLSTDPRSRPCIYRDLCAELMSHGYNYTVGRIRRKWNNLLRKYKRIKNDQNPVKPQWEYLQMMREFLPQNLDFSKWSTSSYSSSTSETLPLRVTIGSPSEIVNNSLPPSSTPSDPCCSNSSPVHVASSILSKDMELSAKRQTLMETYMEQIKEKDAYDMGYKKRKERRDRLKLRALNRIGEELHSIAATQCEILERQEQILKLCSRENVN